MNSAFIIGDSSFSELINVKGEEIISTVLVGHQYPANKTYETFLIEKNFSITIYDVEYETKAKKILEKYQVLNDGTIKKIFSYRKKVDNSNYSAPN